MFLFLSLISYGCEEDIKVNLEKKEKKIIVDGLITDSLGYNYVKLYYSNDYYSVLTDSISGAGITITYLDTIVNFKESSKFKGYYTNNFFKCKEDIKYKLNVTYKNEYIESYTELKKNKNEFYADVSPAFMKYLSISYSNDTLPSRYLFFINDTLKTGIEWLWLDPMDNHYGKGFILKDYPFQINDKIKIERQSISFEIHNFYRLLKIYMQQSQSPYSNPIEFPKGNLSNGAFGIFRASSITIKEIKVEM